MESANEDNAKLESILLDLENNLNKDTALNAVEEIMSVCISTIKRLSNENKISLEALMKIEGGRHLNQNHIGSVQMGEIAYEAINKILCKSGHQ